MASRITFLGTAGDCFVYAKQIRNSGGIVIKTGQCQIFLDPGPGTLLRARHCGINPRETTIIAATHCHDNHIADLNALISSMSFNGIDRQGVVVGSRSVIKGTERRCPTITQFHSSCVEKVIPLEDSQKVGIENLEIHAIKAFHDDPTAIGLKILAPDFVLGYTGDTAYSEDLPERYKDCDILILNTVHAEKSGSDNNLTSDDAIRLISATLPQLAIITHFGKSMMQSDPILEARKIQRETGVQVIAAGDVMVISPNYYSAEMQHKNPYII